VFVFIKENLYITWPIYFD